MSSDTLGSFEALAGVSSLRNAFVKHKKVVFAVLGGILFLLVLVIVLATVFSTSSFATIDANTTGDQEVPLVSDPDVLDTTGDQNVPLVSDQILNGDKIYLKYNNQYLSVSSSNTWALSDTPRVLQIELQELEGETYKTGDPILTKMYFKLKDVDTETYAQVGGKTFLVCTYSWTSTPESSLFLGGTDTDSSSTVENLAIVSGDSFALKAIDDDGVCAQGYPIYYSGSRFTISSTNKLWQIIKVALAN
jgi:hypothetical protein